MLLVRAGVGANTSCVVACGNDLIGETFNEQPFGVSTYPIATHPPTQPIFRTKPARVACSISLVESDQG